MRQGRPVIARVPFKGKDRVSAIKSFLEQVASEAVRNHSPHDPIKVEYVPVSMQGVEIKLTPQFRFSVPLHINSSCDDDDCTPFSEPPMINLRLEIFKSDDIKITSVITGECENNTCIVTYTLSGELGDFIRVIKKYNEIKGEAVMGHGL